MARSIALNILVALQLLLALAWPAQASTMEDVQHRSMHTVLAQHMHDNPHDHGHDSQLDAATSLDCAADNTASDHHHHDFNVSLALLVQRSESLASGHCIHNPCVLPAMFSADLRQHLRPPAA